jgi:hypothetical protein
MVNGSCCCGAIRFVVEAAPTMMARCHCTRCRKVGASTFVFVARDTFRLLSGAEHVRDFQPAPPYAFVRSFCGLCGTALGEVGGTSDPFPVAADALDDDPGVRVRFHEYVAEKPAWSVIGDDARQFPGDPRA